MIPCITTMNAAEAAVKGLEAVRSKGLTVKAIQDYHASQAQEAGSSGKDIG